MADCDSHAALAALAEELRAFREALRAFFADHKIALLDKRIAGLAADIARLDERIAVLRATRREQDTQRDDLKHAIPENGGDRIAELGREIDTKAAVRAERKHRAESYARIARPLGLAEPRDADVVLANRSAIAGEIETASAREADIQNETVETGIEFRKLNDEHAELSEEIASLKSRRSNIPARILAIRAQLCTALRLDDDEVPFAGELIEVRRDESAWEGAAERLLHNFALSLLVPDEHYAAVADWVDATHLGSRLVYYRVQGRSGAVRARRDPRAMTNKLAIKDDSPFYDWLERQLGRAFRPRLLCEPRAVPARGESHHARRPDEARRRPAREGRPQPHRRPHPLVLGWSNDAQDRRAGEGRRRAAGAHPGWEPRSRSLGRERTALRDRLGLLQQLSVYASFSDLDWGSIAVEIERLEEERRQLEEDSDMLKTLKPRQTRGASDCRSARGLRIVRANAPSSMSAAPRPGGRRRSPPPTSPHLPRTRARYVPKLEHCVPRPGRAPSDRGVLRRPRARDARLAAGTYRRRRPQAGTSARQDRPRDERLANRWPGETREVDASVEAAGEYRQMLATLQADDLPRFEARFKELLNENTIREVANFQSQLSRERETIRSASTIINRSLREIDYNPGATSCSRREPTTDRRDARLPARAARLHRRRADGLGRSAYSEAKFLQVKRIIERFRGREGTTELDKRWTRKVTDVRNWFVFSASRALARGRQRARALLRLRRQVGRPEGEARLHHPRGQPRLPVRPRVGRRLRSRSFRFVVIDEAFGRGSDESARYGLDLFKQLDLQLLIVTPLQKIHIIEPYVASVGFVHNEDGRRSRLRNLTIEEYRAEKLRRAG